MASSLMEAYKWWGGDKEINIVGSYRIILRLYLFPQDNVYEKWLDLKLSFAFFREKGMIDHWSLARSTSRGVFLGPNDQQ